jgi:hypothetical protein
MKEVTVNLSEHFTLAEMCKTSAKLKNVPNDAQVENLKRLSRPKVRVRLIQT